MAKPPRNRLSDHAYSELLQHHRALRQEEDRRRAAERLSADGLCPATDGDEQGVTTHTPTHNQQ